MNKFYFLLLVAFVVGCSTNSTVQKERKVAGDYRFSISFEGEKTYSLPFNLSIKSDSSMVITNGNEKISISEYQWKGDSLFFNMPVFLTHFKLLFTDDSFTGEWIKSDRENPVHYAVKGVKNKPRFLAKPTSQNVSGNWETTFFYPDGKSYPAIGEFTQNGTTVTGTFLTETGDYRFLGGVMDADSLKLSAFDGSHAFLFLAKVSDDSIKGLFKGSHTHIEYWSAHRKADVSLANPDSMTFLNPGYETVSFAFPNLQGDTIAYPSASFENKAVIIQLMGSWCPNCMDETKFLSELHKKYQPQGLEVVALSFERFRDYKKAVKAVKRVKDHFDADYTFLIAGDDKKATAEKALPMLNHVLSFPTTIFIDKEGKVRLIHTGFSGPGTSQYNDFVIKATALVEEMVKK